MNDAHRVLIVSFFYPPDPAVGGRRVAKFARYLPELGWRPTVLTAATASDPAETAHVVATPWWSPWEGIPGGAASGDAPRPAPQDTPAAESDSGRRAASLRERAEAGGGLSRLAYRAARHLLPLSTVRMPDATLGWVPYAVARGTELLRARRFDALLSSFGPPSSHIVASRLQAHSGIPWIADYRDLWSENHWDHRVAPFRWAERALERTVLRRAAAITSVAPGWAARLEALHGVPARVVYNGFDPADYPGEPAGPAESGQATGSGSAAAESGAGVGHTGAQLVLTYVGTLHYPAQDPSPLFEAVARLETARAADLDEAGLQLRFLGTDAGPLESLARRFNVERRVRVLSRVPHRECLAAQRRSSALLFLGWSAPDESLLTAKLFEYLGARRPILAVGPAGGPDSVLLQECGHPGLTADPGEIARRLEGWLDELGRGGRIASAGDARAIEKYTRRSQTALLAEALESVTRLR